MDNNDIVRRYQSVKTERTSDVESLWKLLERFVMPLRGEFFEGKETDGRPDYRRRELYDSTAHEAAFSLAASLHSNLVPASARWFDLRFKSAGANENKDAKAWLEKASEIMFYELLQSDFNEEIDETFLDLVAFGTSILIEEEDTDTGELDFVSVPIRECYFEEGYRNQVRRFYRKLEWTALQIADKWGVENMPDVVKAAYDSSDVHTYFEIVYCIFERDKDEIAGVDTSKPAAPTRLPYGYKYVLATTRESLGEEGGYYEMPAFIVRWRKTAGSIWGHSPGIVVLSNIMTLNQTYQGIIESTEKMLEPPMMTTQMGLMSDLDMRRAGLTVVRDMNDLAPLPVGGDITAGEILKQDLRSQIRRAFFEDQLALKESPAMTATEVNVRYDLMQRLLGPTLGRLQSDLLNPLIQRTFNILLRSGVIPPPPDEVREAGDIDIEYVGPLPRAQKMEMATTMVGYYGQLASFAEVNPELLDIVDADKLWLKVGELSAVPADSLNSPDDISKIRQDRQKQAEQIQQQEQAKTQSETIRNVGQGVSALPAEAIPHLQEAIGGR